jgi:hypothetical protein
VRRKAAKLVSDDAHTARIAWWGAFLATLILLAGLSIVRSAQAATPVLGPLPITSMALGEETEEEESEEEESASDECELEAESQAEADECDVVESSGELPTNCRLSSAEAAVALNTAQAKLSLAVRYTAPSPGSVGVALWLRGRRGPLSLDGGRKRIGTAGVIHLTQSLDETETAKVLAARSFIVALRPSGAPHSCHALLEQHLTVKRNTGAGPTWMARNSSFRPAPRR